MNSSELDKLLHLRNSLDNEFKIILSSLKRRKNIIKNVIDLKRSGEGIGPISSYPFFGPLRELKILNHFNDDLRSLSIKELLSLSLIIEGQFLDVSGENYPAWSELDHINADCSNDNGVSIIHKMINPVFLKVFDKETFDKLPLKNEFKILKSIESSL